ncbi:MAG: hypothetical protein K2H28_02240 [Ruminococcus sp.]|nr:hypothetical protein [Ruminococcus sp.]
MPKLVKKMSRDFTIINNKLLRDGNLGSSERGLLVTMLSLPDGWSFSIRGLAQILPDGITKISNTLNKLESLNYTLDVRDDTRTAELQTGITSSVMSLWKILTLLTLTRPMTILRPKHRLFLKNMTNILKNLIRKT